MTHGPLPSRFGPFYISPRRKLILWKFLVWPLLGILGVLLVGNVVLMAIFMASDTTNADSDNLDFALYKNSRFGECVAGSPANVDCSRMDGHLLSDKFSSYSGATKKGHNYLYHLEYPKDPEDLDNGNNATYSWCELASCLAGFKVIPSSPRKSAFRPNGVMQLFYLEIMGVSGLWALKNEFLIPPEHEILCEGLDWFSKGLIAHSLVSFVFWWYSFIAILSTPYDATTMSIIAWVTVWCYAHATQYHPISCLLDKRPGWKKPVVWTLIAATAAQWIATFYAMIARHDAWSAMTGGLGDTNQKRYHCMEDRIQDAPGVSQCSPQQLCSKDWLFGDPGSAPNSDLVMWVYFGGFYFTTACLFFLFLGIAIALCHERRWSRLGTYVRRGKPIVPIACATLLTIALGIYLLVTIPRDWNRDNRETGVAYDMNCRAVHVAISGWRYYLDVNDAGRALRVARMWFSA